MQLDTQKEHIIGVVGTVAFHLLVLIFLLFYYIHPSLPPTQDDLEGVPVMFGNVPDASAINEPSGRGEGTKPDASVEESPTQNAPNVETTTPNPQLEKEDNTTVTQDNEETIALKKAKEAELEKIKIEKKQTVLASEKKQKAETERKAKVEAEKKQSINNQMAGLFGNATGSGSRGNTSGTGTQGVPTGNASYGKTSGVGGFGTYDLGGRGVGKDGVILPSYTANDNGVVVIDIIVDPTGNVVEVNIAKGTNTPNASLQREALKAAKKTKFAVVSTLGNQKGTITYKFNLN